MSLFARKFFVAVAAFSGLIAGCVPDSERVNDPDTSEGGEDVLESTLEAYREFSEVEFLKTVDDLDVYDAEYFPNGSVSYWVKFKEKAKGAEEFCDFIGNFIKTPRDEIYEGDLKNLRLSQEFVDAHEGDIRICSARIDQHQGSALIFYPSGAEFGSNEEVSVYFVESSVGW